MCVIIHKPKNIDIEEKILRVCWQENKDGAGIMYSYNDHLYVEKGFMRFKKFYKAYNRLKDKELVIHFRYATHGNIDRDMTHPFIINEKIAVMHNGIIDIPHNIPNSISDSFYFVKNYLEAMPDNFLESPAVVSLIKYRIGHSILVFMDYRGKVTKIGYKADGIEFRGCWFSNLYWIVGMDEDVIKEVYSLGVLEK